MILSGYRSEIPDERDILRVTFVDGISSSIRDNCTCECEREYSITRSVKVRNSSKRCQSVANHVTS